MRLTFRDLMTQLGVPHELSPYEAYPFNVYDGAKGLTCSAEVRMGTSTDEVEAEVQLMYDTPPEGKPPMQQIIWFRIKPLSGNDWETREARLRGEPVDNNLYNWQEKCCKFYGALAASLKIDQIPDIDDLIEEIFFSKERFYDQYGGGGGKSPKIKPAALLGIKKGQGF